MPRANYTLLIGFGSLREICRDSHRVVHEVVDDDVRRVDQRRDVAFFFGFVGGLPRGRRGGGAAGASRSRTSTPSASHKRLIVTIVEFASPRSIPCSATISISSVRNASSACVQPRSSRSRRTFAAMRPTMSMYVARA